MRSLTPSIDSTNAMRSLPLIQTGVFFGSPISKASLMEQRNRVIARHPRTTFVAAHLAESSEDLSYVAKLLERFPNLSIDISARTPELGRQPYTAREFVIRFADRIL